MIFLEVEKKIKNKTIFILILKNQNENCFIFNLNFLLLNLRVINLFMMTIL